MLVLVGAGFTKHIVKEKVQLSKLPEGIRPLVDVRSCLAFENPGSSTDGKFELGSCFMSQRR